MRSYNISAAITTDPSAADRKSIAPAELPPYTPVPNIIIDELMRTLKPRALKVLLAILRYTWGWQKESDRISLNQLAEITGMDRGNVSKAVKQIGPIVSIAPGNPWTNQAAEYRIDVDPLLSKQLQAVVNLTTGPVVKTTTGPVVKTPTIQRKKKIKEDSAKALTSSPSRRGEKPARRDPAQVAAFAAWYASYPKHVGQKPALESWLKLDPNPALIAEIMVATNRYAEAKRDSEFIHNPATWLNQEHWTDELVGYEPIPEPPKILKREGDMLMLDVKGGMVMSVGTYQRRYNIQVAA